MQYNKIDLKQYLKQYKQREPSYDEIQDFKNHLANLQKVDANESEEHQKNKFRDFLREAFNYECNTKGRIDLAIYNYYDEIEVIIEFKSLKNKQEFPKDSNSLQCKSFYETILYYLRESKTNNNIKHIVLATINKLFIIDAKEYEVFKNNKELLRAYKNCDTNEGNDTSTNKFYDEARKIIESMTQTFQYVYVELDSINLDSKYVIKQTAHLDQIPLIYVILSPQSLLKQKLYIDANTLNKNFYDELLHILGLQEVTQSSKVLIQANLTPNTLLDSICKKFNLCREGDFETIFSLLIIWNNRILFLRLLESMLLSFNHIQKPFLDIDVIKDFKALNTLFFDILAKKEQQRDFIRGLEFIPYLNSSLFDKKEIEYTKEIDKLDSNKLALFKHSILKIDKTYKNVESLPLLDYLFAFLHAYDFTTTPKDIINHTKINYDKLINPSVLGLVFEKLNGYKEGSFYTPSFITSYMCKETLEKVVLEKFNEVKKWDCQNLESLKHKIDKLTDSKEGYKEANEIFNSIRVLDPAVGSGHFLVSMLNVMIELKFKLKILCNENYERLKDIWLSIENDEILIKDSNNIIHNYQIPQHENMQSHKLQKALFYNKRILIESCLFGVDINDNSCEITKLRLWIELLKYSYYIFDSKGNNTKSIETLPNIDINIKCGNSLINRFDLKDTLKHIPNIKHQIKRYKELVFQYKNTNKIFNISKQEMNAQIENIKQAFTLTLKDSKTKNELEKQIDIHIKNYGTKLLDNESLLYGLSYTHNIFGNPELSKEQEEQSYISYGKIVALRKKLDSTISGESYENAFEYRFAFPEVLDSNGDFLGFDIVIGNPPYIDYRKIDIHTKLFLSKKSDIYKINKEGSIFVYFIEKAKWLIKSNGYFCFINPIAYIVQNSGMGVRDFIDNNLTLISLIDISNFKVFDSASTYTCINHFCHKNTNIKTIKFGKAKSNALNSMEVKYIPQVKVYNISIQLDCVTTKIISSKHLTLSKYCDIFCGLSAAGFRANVLNEQKRNSIPFLESSDIYRYDFSSGKYIKNTAKCYSKDKRKIFQDSEIIFMARMTNFIRCCVAPKGYYGGKVNILHNFKIDKNLILGILNSKLMSYFYQRKYFATHMQGGAFGFDTISVKNLPIPNFTKQNKHIADEIIRLVDEIIESKKCLYSALNEDIKLSLNKENNDVKNNDLTELKLDINDKELMKPNNEISNNKNNEVMRHNNTYKSNNLKSNNDKKDSLYKFLNKDYNNSTQELESQIDSLVYRLYKLTDEEIKIIEND